MHFTHKLWINFHIHITNYAPHMAAVYAVFFSKRKRWQNRGGTG